MKKLLLVFAACLSLSAQQASYITVSVPVTTTKASLYSLVSTYMAASRPNDSFSDSCTWVQYTAAKANTGNVLVGDYTVATGTAPTRQAGAELAAGEGVYESVTVNRSNLVNLKQIFVIADANTQYINVRIRY